MKLRIIFTSIIVVASLAPTFGSAATLLLPYFEVDLKSSAAAKTAYSKFVRTCTTAGGVVEQAGENKWACVKPTTPK